MNPLDLAIATFRRLIPRAPEVEDPPIATTSRAIVDEDHNLVAYAKDGKLYNSEGDVLSTPRLPVVTKTDSYTLALGDENRVIAIDSASAEDWTIPANADVEFPLGTEIAGAQLGAGLVTIDPAVGVTIISHNNLVDSAGEGASWAIKKVASDTWLLAGKLA